MCIVSVRQSSLAAAGVVIACQFMQVRDSVWGVVKEYLLEEESQLPFSPTLEPPFAWWRCEPHQQGAGSEPESLDFSPHDAIVKVRLGTERGRVCIGNDMGLKRITSKQFLMHELHSLFMTFFVSPNIFNLWKIPLFISIQIFFFLGRYV